MNGKKRFFILAILVVLVVAWLKKANHAAVIDPNAVVVEIAPVKKQTLAIETQTVGTLVAAQNIQIAPEIAGQVAKVYFQDGQFVKQGTPLIQLNDAMYKAKWDAASAQYQFSETTYQRYKRLADKGIISKQDMAKAEADLKEKKAAVEEAEVMVQQMKLIAPFDGMVGKSTVSPGDFVTVGQALVSLTDVHHLHVEYKLPEKCLATLQLGQHVRVTSSAFPEKLFDGVVAYISPTINTQDRTLSVYAEVPNPKAELTAGLFVNVTQALGTQENVLAVPAASLVATIDGHEVMKVVDGKVITVPVEIGQRTGNQVQILKGLNAEDKVVIAGQQKLRDGVNVKVKA